MRLEGELVVQYLLSFKKRLDWTGLDWTGLDWTGLDWTGLVGYWLSSSSVCEGLSERVRSKLKSS
eukprot:scaffold4749_cov174-Ochromonas_danica.AAC.2